VGSGWGMSLGATNRSVRHKPRRFMSVKSGSSGLGLSIMASR
jgi:hypothetical protein